MKLSTPIIQFPSVGPVYAKRLEKLNIKTLDDMLLHIPFRYVDFRQKSMIARVQTGETVTVEGELESIKNIYTKKGKKIQTAEVVDQSGKMTAVWFNQPFLTRTLKEGQKYSLSGEISWYNKKKAIISPEYESFDMPGNSLHTGRLVPIYPETARVSSKWLRTKVHLALNLAKDNLKEYLPKEIIEEFGFPGFSEAISAVHFPESPEEADGARKRLAFDELLFHQLKSLYRKRDWEKVKTTHNLEIDNNTYNKFVSSLPFELTDSQERSIKEIFNDLSGDIPMNRLLEGDVGSGKTVVAAAAAFVSFINGFQTVVMAPTQILAAQHYETFQRIFETFKARVSLVTSAGVKKELGKTDIFVGTHALIHKRVEFSNVSLVVIDEQQRFGVEQRAHLTELSSHGKHAPHILTMTATPIPRTVALTVYGDLNLSTLDELPKGRVPITTWLVPASKRQGAYDWMGQKIKKEKIQAFIVCPLIEESQVESMKQIKAASNEFEKLKKILPDIKIGLLHGKLKANEKDKVLTDFKNGYIQILISTPVVEVGIDIENATIMVIEAAERFGLSQLHQLRGRIGRGTKKSYCLLFTDSGSQIVTTRLQALKKTLSGFKLAELDLQLRGPGEIFGTRQHGFPELKIASWSDTELIKKSRAIAERVIKNPEKFLLLEEKIKIDDVVLN